MQGRLGRVVGVAALLWALVSAGTVLLIIAGEAGVRLQYGSFWAHNLSTISLAGAVLGLVTALGLWRLDRVGAASKLLGLAAGIAAVELVVLLAFDLGLHVSFPAFQALESLNWLGLAGSLCLGAGLLFGSWAPSWVAWLAVATPLMSAAGRLINGAWVRDPGAAPSQLSALLRVGSEITFELFLVGLGVVLIMGAADSAHTSNKRIERTPQTLS